MSPRGFEVTHVGFYPSIPTGSLPRREQPILSVRAADVKNSKAGMLVGFWVVECANDDKMKPIFLEMCVEPSLTT